MASVAPSFEPARAGDPILHDGVTVCGTLPPVPCTAGRVLVEHADVAALGTVVPCSGATAAGPLHPPLPATIVASTTSVLVGGKPMALRVPSPDVTSCGALIGDPKTCGTSTVVVGVYTPLPPCKPPE